MSVESSITIETWKPVPSFEGFYSVSDRGSVRSEINCCLSKKGRLLRPAKRFSKRKGYLFVVLCVKQERKNCFVHRLVAAAFLGVSVLEVNHKDGNPENNLLENLEYVTRLGNARHAVKLGLYRSGDRNSSRLHQERMCRGKDHPCSKFTEQDVLKIRERLANGERGYPIAREFGVDRGAIYAIKNRRTWTHI